MRTLNEVIDAMERCSIPHYFDCKGCPYEDDDAEVGCRSDDRDTDVLHYLKQYKEKWYNLEALAQENRNEFQKLTARIARYEEAIKNCEEAENKYKQMENSIALMILKKGDEVLVMDDNPVLTWDQLKGMKGKPVWVEGYYPSAWYIVREVQKSEDGTEDIILDGFQGLTGIGRDDRYGDVENGWQAYRKERKC